MAKTKIKIKKNDIVRIIAGKEIGKEGKVLKVFPKKEQLIVEKINFIYRHTKPSDKNRQGGIIEKEGPIHFSNAMIVCPNCKRTTRIKVGKLTEDAPEKNRFCAYCSEVLDK